MTHKHNLQSSSPSNETLTLAGATPETVYVRAAADLARILGELHITTTLDPKVRRDANVFWTVSGETLRKAAALAEEQGIKDFDAAAARAAADFELQVAPLVNNARVLLRCIEDEMIARHAPAARDTYALFATLKALSRIRKDPFLAQGVRDLATYLVPAGAKKAVAEPEDTAPPDEPAADGLASSLPEQHRTADGAPPVGRCRFVRWRARRGERARLSGRASPPWTALLPTWWERARFGPASRSPRCGTQAQPLRPARGSRSARRTSAPVRRRCRA